MIEQRQKSHQEPYPAGPLLTQCFQGNFEWREVMGQLGNELREVKLSQTLQML